MALRLSGGGCDNQGRPLEGGRNDRIADRPRRLAIDPAFRLGLAEMDRDGAMGSIWERQPEIPKRHAAKIDEHRIGRNGLNYDRLLFDEMRRRGANSRGRRHTES